MSVFIPSQWQKYATHEHIFMWQLTHTLSACTDAGR